MKINFTQKEYKKLLEMLYIADWVIRAHDTQENPATKPYKDIEQKLLNLASEFGLDDSVEFSQESGHYYLNKKFLEAAMATKHIEEFENATFWEELLERLARRDFIRKYGESTILEMPLAERFEKEMTFFEKYDTEFGKNGLNNLVIKGWNKEKAEVINH